MAFLHDPRIKVLGTRGHMVRPRRGPLQSNILVNRMEFKNLRRQGGMQPTIKEAAIASRRQEATDKIPRQDQLRARIGGRQTFLARRVGEGTPQAQERNGSNINTKSRNVPPISLRKLFKSMLGGAVAHLPAASPGRRSHFDCGFGEPDRVARGRELDGSLSQRLPKRGYVVSLYGPPTRGVEGVYDPRARTRGIS